MFPDLCSSDDALAHGGDQEVRPIDAGRVQALAVHQRPDCRLIQFSCLANADSLLVHRETSRECDRIASSEETIYGACFHRMPPPTGFYFRSVADLQPVAAKEGDPR
jgi:hypothetical protein